MAINFNKIPNEMDETLDTPNPKRTVLDEINERQQLLQQHSINCKNIEPFYEKPQRNGLRYTYKYFCVCPRYNPPYPCEHTGNVVIDRDILTKAEHIAYLSRPNVRIAATRMPPRFYPKKLIVPNCTARISKLAAPDIKHVRHTLNHYQHLLSERHRSALQQYMEEKPTIEYTNIATALQWMEEERRLKKVAKRMEKLRCQKLSRKIKRKQRSQIKKIMWVLFEEMKEFLLNDQFVMDEGSPLVNVIWENLKEFTAGELYWISNLSEYQKVLACNLAVWINKFISNLNIHVNERPQQHQYEQQTRMERLALERQTFLPISDYIPCSSDSEEIY
uniref:SWIM-type domain-containing protein n=1 Tax=Stomoxys calcitrans TaxID=35570 RepID=A0A1I8QE41_STOCA